jgi:agarase
VGAHWYTYADQPLTGRDDGENHRIGFVDVTDTPYPEMVNAARRVANDLYLLRAGSGDAAGPSTTEPRMEE